MHGLQACLIKNITVAAFHIYIQVVKMPLKGEFGGHALNSHGNYIVDHGKNMVKSWNCVFEFLWEPCILPTEPPTKNKNSLRVEINQFCDG